MKALFLIVATCTILLTSSARRCQVKKAKYHLGFQEISAPCTKSYRARCSWFSFDYCTFYQIDQCTHRSNRTEVVYYLGEDCCEGYIAAPNGTCVVVEKVKNEKWYITALNSTTEKPVVWQENNQGFDIDFQDKNFQDIVSGRKDAYRQDENIMVKEKKKESIWTLSHGASAGIGCAVLFLAVIGVLTFIAIRKKRKRRAQRKGGNVRYATPGHPSQNGHLFVQVEEPSYRSHADHSPGGISTGSQVSEALLQEIKVADKYSKESAPLMHRADDVNLDRSSEEEKDSLKMEHMADAKVLKSMDIGNVLVDNQFDVDEKDGKQNLLAEETEKISSAVSSGDKTDTALEIPFKENSDDNQMAPSKDQILSAMVHENQDVVSEPQMESSSSEQSVAKNSDIDLHITETDDECETHI